MHDLLVKLLKTIIFLILWSNNGSSKETTKNRFLSKNLTNRLDLIVGRYVDKNEINLESTKTWKNSDGFTNKKSELSRSYYGVPAPPYIPAFDPISVLASLAFLAFLLQSFAALFDRTRSIIPTIISSRSYDSDYDDRYKETKKSVMRALEEYVTRNY